MIMAGYHIPAGSHADFAAIDVMAQILSDEPSGRLYKSIVETKKASSIGGDTIQLHDPGVVFFLQNSEKRISSPPRAML